MHGLRTSLQRFPALTAAILLAALCMRMLLPPGYMPASTADGQIIVQLCTASGVQDISMPMPDTAGADDGAEASAPCAFAGSGAPMLSGHAGLLLALAIAWLLARGFVPARRPLPAAPAYLRPPAHAPPHPA